MIESKTKKVRRTVEVVVEQSITCNKCGRKDQTFPKPDYCETQEYLHVELVGGYGSRFPGDSVRVKFHVCQDCLGQWVDTFSIAPIYGDELIVS